jgi:hypothetical protein
MILLKILLTILSAATCTGIGVLVHSMDIDIHWLDVYDLDYVFFIESVIKGAAYLLVFAVFAFLAFFIWSNRLCL